MSYCDQSDLESAGITPAQLVQLADDDEDGVADAAVLAEAIAQADGVIDSYLAARYTVPLATVPATIRSASVDLTVRRLYGRRGLVNEARENAYKAAMDYLKALAAGSATLGMAAPPDPTNEGGPQTARTSEDRIFTIGRVSTGETGSLDNF